jgi:serine/threonine-protein kinase
MPRTPARRSSAPDADEAGQARVADQARSDQLARVLRSETFQQADSLKRFLTFVVTEALAGRQAELKEYVIGVQVFRKEETFDPRTDPIVRVQARRLRAKLVRYYREEGQGDPIAIDLPKGGYAPVFRARDRVLLHRPVGTLFVSRNTLAVQYLTDHSPLHDLAYLCDAVRDELVHRLAQLPGLRILAKADEMALDAEGGTSKAAVVIGGNVRRSGHQVRVTVNLVDSSSGCYLWSESVNISEPALSRAHDTIADVVIGRLEPELATDRRATGFSSPAENFAAKNLCLQGRYHLNQRTEEGLKKAVEFFEKAIAEGAGYAPAHSGLADAYGLLTHYGVLAPADVWTKSASHAASAVALDDRSAEAHTSLAHVKATQDWDWLGAAREYQKAIALHPSYATAHHWYAMSCLAPLGRLDEALDEIVTAQSLDPVSSIVARDLAVVHFYRRDFEMALEQCDHTIELNPHFAPAYWMLGVIQEQRRDFDESAAAFQRAAHLSPRAPRVQGALGRTYALSGRKKLALDVLRKLEALAAERYVSPLEFAWIHFALGNVDSGFVWLTKAANDRSFDLICIKVDPRFDPYRDDERFRALMAQVGVE